jgi:prevent-host-death family protein
MITTLARAMKTVSAAEANRQFSKILREVGAGETVIVTSRGKPVAQIQPPDRILADREAAKQELLEYLRSQPTRNLNITWTRDELYDD